LPHGDDGEAIQVPVEALTLPHVERPGRGGRGDPADSDLPEKTDEAAAYSRAPFRHASLSSARGACRRVILALIINAVEEYLLMQDEKRRRVSGGATA
jgi:hypothetical protein